MKRQKILYVFCLNNKPIVILVIQRMNKNIKNKTVSFSKNEKKDKNLFPG